MLETKVIPGKFSLSQIIWVQESMKPRVFSERKGCNGKGKLANERSLGWCSDVISVKMDWWSGCTDMSVCLGVWCWCITKMVAGNNTFLIYSFLPFVFLTILWIFSFKYFHSIPLDQCSGGPGASYSTGSVQWGPGASSSFYVCALGFLQRWLTYVDANLLPLG